MPVGPIVPLHWIMPYDSAIPIANDNNWPRGRQSQAFNRVGTIADNVAQANQVIGSVVPNVSQDRRECLSVRMNVTDDR